MMLYEDIECARRKAVREGLALSLTAMLSRQG